MARLQLQPLWVREIFSIPMPDGVLTAPITLLDCVAETDTIVRALIWENVGPIILYL